MQQLLLSKRLLEEGKAFARRQDPVSCGLAVSLFQDAVELYVWALVKEKGLQVSDASGFTQNLHALKSSGISILGRAKILELNKARVNFKHYGILPAPEEASRFQGYADDFLRTGLKDHFDTDLDSLSLVSLVSFPDVREQLADAESKLAIGDNERATIALAEAKSLLFGRVERMIPRIRTYEFSQHDRALETLSDGGRFGAFRYIGESLTFLRDLVIVSLLQLPLGEYSFIQNRLPVVLRFASGRIQVEMMHSPPNKEECERILEILISLSTRVERITHDVEATK
jgi:hypothetical protein